MGPFDLTAEWGSWISYAVPLFIGLGFGASLEMSGFGDSRKLAAQFYLSDMTVLKVMFTSIVVAGVLIGFSSAMEWVNMDLVWVNPTFLVPGILGGLVMGVGFIVGGFCPGTSIVACSTLKLDGIFFTTGVMFGVFAFGETVGFFDGFWHSTSMGRFTLGDLFGVDTGVVLVGVVIMALTMFLGAEVSESYFGRHVPLEKLRFFPQKKLAYVFGGTLILLGVASMVRGQPSPEQKWDNMADATGAQLQERNVFIHPVEVKEIASNTTLYTRILDVRSEADFNLFHLRDAERVSDADLHSAKFVSSLKQTPENTVFFTASNDETHAVEAWKLLTAQGVPNVYVVEGGINGWLRHDGLPRCLAEPRRAEVADDALAFRFSRALGGQYGSGHSSVKQMKLPDDCGDYSTSIPHDQVEADAAVPRKVKLKRQSGLSGGCG